MKIINRETVPTLDGFFGTRFSEIQNRVVRLTLWHLDGTTSEARFIYPNICWNGDDFNYAGQHIEEWAREMTRFYLKISHYQVHFGSIYKDGSESLSIHFPKKEVPLGKVFWSKRINNGEWLDPVEIAELSKSRQADQYPKHWED